MDDQLLVAAFSRSVPRYTSYPTAAQFSDQTGPADYAAWLGRLPPETRLSLYLHVPYCRELCWYCACHMRVTKRDDILERYRDALLREIETVRRTLGFRPAVHHLHWGGGTPTILKPDDFRQIRDSLGHAFDIDPDAETAVEIDPRTLSEAMVETLAATGTTRVSFGVQDFDPVVQAAINRRQSFAVTRQAVERVRRAGIRSVNLDLVYGLPHQSEETLRATIEQTLSLAPERVAIFGYAHVPWLKRHQTLIAEAALPGPRERWAQSRLAADLLTAAGYVAIGIDHFARPEDRLAQAAAGGRLRRNFQGYTDDNSDALIGFGPSAISALADGYTQNTADIPAWLARVEAGELATARGIALDDEDRLRRDVIERLMCDLRVDLLALLRTRPTLFRALADVHPALAELERAGLVVLEGPTVRIVPQARPLARIVAAAFDASLASPPAPGEALKRYSAAV
jgi:oxygen-independent coproporphyrinogen III oxidase